MQGLGEEGAGVDSAFSRVPDAWPDAQLPCSALVGPLPVPAPWRLGCGRTISTPGRYGLPVRPPLCLLSCPLGLGRGCVCPPSLVSFLSFLFLWGCVLPGMFLFLIFLPFLLASTLLSSPCALLPPLDPAPLFSPSPPPADLLEI